MNATQEKRTNDRIKFSWPLWFAYEGNDEVFRGQIQDLNQQHVSFTVDQHVCPHVGQHIMTRFSYPRSEEDQFDMDSYLHWGEVIRVDCVDWNHRRVAMRLHEQVKLKATADNSASVARTA